MASEWCAANVLVSQLRTRASVIGICSQLPTNQMPRCPHDRAEAILHSLWFENALERRKEGYPTFALKSRPFQTRCRARKIKPRLL